MSWPVVIEQRVQWGEMDAYGHVNNARYLTWFESARIALFEEVGLVGADSSGGVGPILARIECNFRRPVVYPATVQCVSRVVSLGRTSFVLDHAVVQDSEVVAQGEGVIVVLDYRTGDKVPLSESLRSALESLK